MAIDATATSADFTVTKYGRVCLLTPASDAAIDWIAAFVPYDAVLFSSSVVVESRYMASILEVIAFDGLTVKDNCWNC